MSRENITALFLAALCGFTAFAALSSPNMVPNPSLKFRVIGGISFFFLSLFITFIIRCAYRLQNWLNGGL